MWEKVCSAFVLSIPATQERRPCPPVSKPLRRPRLRQRSRASPNSRLSSGTGSLPTSPRAGRRRLPQVRTPPPYGAGSGTRRAASLLGMRAKRFGPPLWQATRAWIIGRKSLKRLNPRPGLPQPSTALPARARFAMLRVASLLTMWAERLGPLLRQATSARKIGSKSLKRLIPRPGLPQTSTPPPARARFATRYVAPRPEGGEGAPAASAGDERPENRAEVLEKVDSAPGVATAAAAAALSGGLRDATRRGATVRPSRLFPDWRHAVNA